MGLWGICGMVYVYTHWVVLGFGYRILDHFCTLLLKVLGRNAQIRVDQDQVHSRRVLSINFANSYSPRSPELSPSDYWLWGYLKMLC